MERPLASFAAGVILVVLGAPAYGQMAPTGQGPVVRAAARQARGLARAAVAATAARQRHAASVWSDATHQLQPGDDVRAILDDGTPVRRRFRGADDEAIILAVDPSDRHLPRAHVVRLSVTHRSSRRRSESIGLGLGAVVGAFVWNRRCGRPQNNCQEDTMLYFGGPVLAGGLVAQLFPARPVWREIYVRP